MLSIDFTTLCLLSLSLLARHLGSMAVLSNTKLVAKYAKEFSVEPAEIASAIGTVLTVIPVVFVGCLFLPSFFDSAEAVSAEYLMLRGVGVFLMALGQYLNFSVFSVLGSSGVYYGEKWPEIYTDLPKR